MVMLARKDLGRADIYYVVKPHVGHAAQATRDRILLASLAVGPGCSLSLIPRPLFIALNIYASPLHLVLTTMLHEVVKGH